MQDNQLPSVSVKGTPPAAQKPDYKLWYIVCLFGIIALVVITVLGLTLIRPNADNTSLIATVVGLAVLAVPALLTLIKGAENGAAIQVYHEAVNSKMDAWIKAAEEVARLKAQAAAGASAGDVAAKLAEVSDKNTASLQAQLEEVRAQIAANTAARMVPGLAPIGAGQAHAAQGPAVLTAGPVLSLLPDEATVRVPLPLNTRSVDVTPQGDAKPPVDPSTHL